MGSVINGGPQTEVNHKTIMKGKHRPHPTPAGALIQQLGITQGEFSKKSKLSENENHGSMTQILPFKSFSKIRTK
jgi:hypothetical protein